MKTIARFVCLGCLALTGISLSAKTYTPADIGTICGVQPFAGGTVASNATTPAFFSDLSTTNCSGTIITLLGGVSFFDDSLNPVTGASVTGITLTQGSNTSTLPVDMFSTTMPVTYGPSVNTSNSVTINPGDLNLAFTLSIPPSQYSYSLTTKGVPNGGFVIWNDVEAAKTSEPAAWLLAAAAAFSLAFALRLAGPPWRQAKESRTPRTACPRSAC